MGRGSLNGKRLKGTAQPWCPGLSNHPACRPHRGVNPSPRSRPPAPSGTLRCWVGTVRPRHRSGWSPSLPATEPPPRVEVAASNATDTTVPAPRAAAGHPTTLPPWCHPRRSDTWTTTTNPHSHSRHHHHGRPKVSCRPLVTPTPCRCDRFPRGGQRCRRLRRRNFGIALTNTNAVRRRRWAFPTTTIPTKWRGPFSICATNGNCNNSNDHRRDNNGVRRKRPITTNQRNRNNNRNNHHHYRNNRNTNRRPTICAPANNCPWRQGPVVHRSLRDGAAVDPDRCHLHRPIKWPPPLLLPPPPLPSTTIP